LFLPYFVQDFAAARLLQRYELSPNPNPKDNTIDILSGDVGIHSEETFENFGAITVHDGGTLRNLAEMNILLDEDGGGGGLLTITIEVGGLLENEFRLDFCFRRVGNGR